MRVLLVEPGKRPVLKEIDGSLKSMQEIVGGTIQAIYPFDEPVVLICNDEGKLLGLPLNRALRDEKDRIYDVIAGTFSCVGRRRTVITWRAYQIVWQEATERGLMHRNRLFDSMES